MSERRARLRAVWRGLLAGFTFGLYRPCDLRILGASDSVLEPAALLHCETCGSCAHYTLREFSKTYRKCGKNAAAWTRGRRTDIRAMDAACKFWEPKDERA